MESIYAGAFNIVISAVDMRIDFIKVEPELDEKGNVVAENRELGQRIALALPLAKDFAAKISDAIRDYEMKVGTIVEISKKDEERK